MKKSVPENSTGRHNTRLAAMLVGASLCLGLAPLGAQSTELFGLPVPAGTYAPQVADGYWLLLGPLSPGRHKISVSVTPDPNLGSPFQVTYNITVASSNSE